MYQAGAKGIDTGDTYFGEVIQTKASGASPARKWLNRDRIQKMPIYGGKPLEANINHSRWIVDCPNCNNAEFMFEDKLFYCSLCHNYNIDGKVLKVKTPKERKEIEDILKVRPIKNRHWKPGETIEGLKNENISHLEVT